MPTKTKLLEKQGIRAAKQLDDIMSGKMKISDAPGKKTSQANRKGGGTPTADSETELASRYIRLLSFILPGMAYKLSKIDDPRMKKKCTHTLETLMVYGIIAFLANLQSRRAANRDIGGMPAYEALNAVIPELETMPHADTLARLLARIDVDKIESYYAEMLEQFIKSDSFRKINPGKLLIAVDGTMKFSMDYRYDNRALRRHKGGEGKEWYCTYILESVLILENGAVIPLLTETLENEEGWLDDEKVKQDCEQKAFRRLAEKLEKLIGKGGATIVLDGIYASGPVVSLCNFSNWDFMIVLKNGSMPALWDDFNGLRKCEPDNRLCVQRGKRSQTFHWSNGIEHVYGANNKILKLNVVTCNEEWTEANSRKGVGPQRMTTNYAWLSSAKVTIKNAVNLCDTARRRWRIENHIKTEKHNGYNYTHCYSYNWNVMKGYHCLMKIAHFINTLITFSIAVREYLTAEGIEGFIKKAWRLIIARRSNLCKDNQCDIGDLHNPKRLRFNFKALKLTS